VTRRWCLFLDLDGTLIEIAASPSAVAVPADLAPLLTELQASLDGALAIVSGRPIAEIDRLLRPLRLAAAGVHGCEMRAHAHGTIELATPPFPHRMLASLRDRLGSHNGVVIEEKGSGVALHYRHAPELESRIRALAREMPLEDHGLHIVHGRKVVELLPARASKRAAVEDFLTRAPFRDRQPIMIGDDAADAPAIDAVRALGGLGLRVAGEHFAPHDADFAGPADVRQWLRTFADGRVPSRPTPLHESA
jgi:trehalose 6-phosphate phosphatase